MASPANSSQTQRELIDYKFNEVFKRLDRMEGKMDNFTYIRQGDFDEFKTYVDKTYATKEEVKPWIRFSYGLITGVGLGMIGFVFWLLERALR